RRRGAEARVLANAATKVNRPRVAVLMGPSAGSQYVFSRLAAEVDLVAVVKQQRPRREVLRAVFRRGKKLRRGYWLDRLLLGAYTKLKLKRQALACPEYRAVRAASDFETDGAVLRVESINDPSVIDLLQKSQPELVVVLGTSIIKEPVLAAAPCFVNLHAGITPMYRGAHGQFWAVLNRDFENVGVTLHFVDKGIDTGAIVKQGRFPFEPAIDNLLTLLAKSSVTGASVLLDWIHQNRDDFRASPTLTPPGPSQLHYSPGLSDHRRFEQIARDMSQDQLSKAA
ncbi:MAG: formyl transferase, partial [Planctomycetaceae bacterium]